MRTQSILATLLTLALVAVLAMGIQNMPASPDTNVRAASVAPIFIAGTANKTCQQLADLMALGQTWIELKVDPNADGNYTDGTLSVTVSNTTNDKTFDWTSNIGVDAVFVKAGAAGSNLYRYDPPAEVTGDTNLTSPGAGTTNGISHIAFCYDTGDPTSTPTNSPVPPTNTPTNTATNTPVDPTNTPTNTATNTPTDTPTNTPVVPSSTPTDTPTNTPVVPSSTPTDTPTNTPVVPSATPSNTPVEPSATPSNTPVEPSATPSNTPVEPSATPSNTPVVPSATPSNTPVEPSATPSNTPVVPSATPSNTPVGPTNTPVPPTNTPVGPTNTPVPPTNTPVGPTATNLPPSDPTATTPPPVDPTATNAPPVVLPTDPPAVPTATSAPACTSLTLPTLSMSAAPAQVLPGTEAAYTVRVSNPHATDLSQVTVSASLSNLSQYVSATATQGQPSFDAGSNSVSLVLASLPAGQTVDLTIRVLVAANAPASSPVTANASAGVNGTTCLQASSTVTVTPAGIPVTGGGPGWEEIRVMLFAGLTLIAGAVWAGRQLARRRLIGR